MNPKAERNDPTTGNLQDQRAKPGEDLRCCVCLPTRPHSMPSSLLFPLSPPPSSIRSSLLSPPLFPPPFSPLPSLLLHARKSPTAFRVIPLTLAAWNIRCRLDNPTSNRPERRTALVAREVARYKVDLPNFSETPFSEQCQVEEVNAGCTLFWTGCPKAERCDAGVAFEIRSDIVG
ncbi:unnamed protein product [Schistocephalus solidus]|uniref:Uncharacterized protein n=1 Tax=Schistocephalus solidus TaxID=70667 RepID=A0A183TF55_SCHSO|nr:unnamed protein product [Schistocephalus solidus]